MFHIIIVIRRKVKQKNEAPHTTKSPMKGFPQAFYRL